jgi:hypothetical protein
VEPKHLWSVHQWEVVDELPTLLNGLAMWNTIALVKVECFCKHVISKPHLRFGIILIMA